MLYYCEYTWHHGTTIDQVRRRIVQQDDAQGANVRKAVRGWYSLAGGGAGFLLLDVAAPQELNNILQPYMDLMAWDVRSVFELPYEEAVQRFRSAG